MKNLFSLLTFGFCFITFSSFAQQINTYPSELKQLRENVIADFLKDSATNKKIGQLLSELDEKGSWPSIDYTSTRRSDWPVLEHLENLQLITKAYQMKGTSFYQSQNVKKKAFLALNYWLDNNFYSTNWWYSQIGSPNKLAPILVALENEMTAEKMQLGIKQLNKAKIGMTGQNKIWLSGNVMLKALLLRNADSVRIASAAIKNELGIKPGEGIQMDNSYHQHGRQLQFGNYGMHYLDDMIRWISVLRNTPFQFDENKVSVLRNYVLEGQQWVMWKKAMDLSACGRQLFIGAPEAKKDTVRYFMSHLAKIDPQFATAYSDVNDYKKTIGNKHFWRSDFHVSRTANYYFSVKMCSSRVLGAESANSENLQGYYMGDGVALLYQTQDEYKDIFPFWDWKKLPGTTLRENDTKLPVLTGRGYHIESDFVGGVSDGLNGIAVLKYNRDGLQANKSWFMFNDQIICLGNGISTKEKDVVATTLNQSYWKGDVLVSTKKRPSIVEGTKSFSNPKWLLHNDIGYLFPKGGNLKLEAKTVEGSWKKVADLYPEESIKAPIFKLWFDHGSTPTNQSYEYILLPNADQSTMKKLGKDNGFIIDNQIEYQSVVSKDQKLAGIVFYKALKSPVFDGVAVDNSCVILLEKETNGIRISLSDPTQKLQKITLTVNGNYTNENAENSNGTTSITFDLPQMLNAGSTVSVFLKKK